MSYEITNIFIYPIKGLAGIEVTVAQVMHRGLEHDRRMMLVDENGLFLSQRTIPEMALYKIEIVKDGYLVTYEGDSLHINIDYSKEVGVEVSVWDDRLTCFEVSSRASNWFSTKLGMKLRLVTMTKASKRIKELLVAPYATDVSLADAYPILLLGRASVDELNSRLGKKIAIERFRPSIVIATCEAHVEDLPQDLFTESGVKLRVIKPCARCQVVNIDPQDASISKDVLNELSKYRKVGNNVNFAANTIALSIGKITVGEILHSQLFEEKES